MRDWARNMSLTARSNFSLRLFSSIIPLRLEIESFMLTVTAPITSESITKAHTIMNNTKYRADNA